MRTILIRSLCVLTLALAPVVTHAAAAKKTSTARSLARSAKTVAKSGARATAKVAGTAASTVRAAGPRRLEDIHIEGEVPVPQVLFITARDQRRFLESHHDMYLRTSRELGEMTPLPARVVLTPAPGATPASGMATPSGAAPAPPATPAPKPTTPAKSEDGR